jgi:hypothetical protein
VELATVSGGDFFARTEVAFADAFGDASDDALGADLAGALPDFLPAVLMGGLVGLRGDAGRVVLRVFWAGFFSPARDAFAGAVATDFLRVFLDIRLPFVAFGGSVFGFCEFCPGRYATAVTLCKSADLGVWLQGIRRNPSGSC